MDVADISQSSSSDGIRLKERLICFISELLEDRTKAGAKALAVQNPTGLFTSKIDEFGDLAEAMHAVQQ